MQRERHEVIAITQLFRNCTIQQAVGPIQPRFLCFPFCI